MWERWNGDQMRDDPEMNSYNHYAYGAVADWIYRYAAGVDATAFDAGFHTIVLHPNFDARLHDIDFSYASPYGTVRSAWSVDGDRVHWTVTIPANAVGEMPVTSEQARSWRVDGKPLAEAAMRVSSPEGGIIFQLAAGTYSIEAPMAKESRGRSGN
jgi:alpha-L-rhamnosidase